MKFVLDTNVIINEKVDEFLKDMPEKEDIEILIPEIVIRELEHIAGKGKDEGIKGIEYIKKLRENLDVKIVSSQENKAETGINRNDRIIMNIAKENNAVLVTSDRLLAKISELYDVHVRLLKFTHKEPEIFKFFDENTLSLHVKGGVIFAKKGGVGNFRLEKISEGISEEKIKEYADEIYEYGKENKFIEIEERGVTVIQVGIFRVVLAKPPFCDGYEITAVKPLVKKTLEDYNITKKLLKRLEERAEGIFISGPPGAGKSTFAQGLAEFYLNKGKIVKTMESPRDLQVRDEISQYAPLEGNMEKTADILLLVRPDYTIYDELRKTKDFEIFADMRLAGVGMVGVTHSSKPIDAIQRLIGRVEFGMIPHIIDTVIFIKGGVIEKVYELNMEIKVPRGMRDMDLTRPVIVVRDFDKLNVEYELYSFGNEVVVAPVKTKEMTKTENELGISGISIMKSKKHITIKANTNFTGETKIYADDEFLFSDFCRNGSVRILRNTHYGNIIMDCLKAGKKIEMR
ncbi:MAG: ATPase [Candidatus Altiarchaeales archaeon HGW-Altiarchaeales-1]|nr:MAG: ATPase [Candidatus Altiarchaeales archaeon HGW-Altiarchaeales-1]